MSIRIIGFFLASLFFLTLCRPGVVAQDRKPTEAEARQVVQRWIAHYGRGCLKLVSLRKVNGVRQTLYGQPIYIMKCQLVLEATRHCVIGKITKLSASPVDNPPPANSYENWGLRAGQRSTIPHDVGFFWTDNGWVGEE